MNQTHDWAKTSWVESANEPGADFPIHNLPMGVYRGADGGGRIGVAIGEMVLDVNECVERGLLAGVSGEFANALQADCLNRLMAMGRSAWRSARNAVFGVLESSAGKDVRTRAEAHLIGMGDVEMLLPAKIGDYTDFYASLHHATNVGSMFRPDQPLMPNWKHLPVGYHGRASSIVVSGTPIHRPMGQTKGDADAAPTFGPCKLLDYEMELGWFIGRGNELGTRLQMAGLENQIFGLVLVNDWSARDVQKWEYQPLGPFNAKNFGTTISPWVVTMEALEPFRRPGVKRAVGDPAELAYLREAPGENWGLEIEVEVWLSSAEMRKRGMAEVMISRGSFADMYWTIAQMTVHHTSTGCNLRPGDLLASGTISGASETSRGCLLERTWRGEKPIDLPDGTQRRFLLDGDEVVMRGWCVDGGGRRMGLGACQGKVEPMVR